MPHHLTSLFKSAVGIANGVLGNSVNLKSGVLKGDKNRKRNEDRDQNRDLLKGGKGENQRENQREEKLRTENLGLGGVAGDEGEIVGGDLVEGEDVVEAGEMSGIGKIGEISGRGGRSETSKNCNLIDTSGSAATNLKENLLPPTPCLRAVDGLDVEVSPTDGLGGFDGEDGEGGDGCGSVDEEDGGGDGVTENTIAVAFENGGKKHSGVNATPASIPLPMSSTTSSINTISETEHTATRNRASTILRKPIVTHRRDCLDWKVGYGGYEGLECGGKGERLRSFGSVKSEVIGEREKERERNVRLEKERMERGERDLHHENPLHSHPIQPTTISHGTPPTTSPLYTCTSSPSINSSNSKSRAFRHSYTVPIHGFNFMGKGAEGLTDVEGIAEGIENIGGVSGVSGMGRGTARDRYSGNSNASVSGSGSGAMGMGMGMGSRTGSFLRRASVSFKGLGAGMGAGMGFMRSSSGGIAVGGTGEGMQALGGNAEKLDSNTIPVEYLRGVGGYAGDGMGMGIGREKIEMDTEKRHSYRHSLILPKFEWEEEFVGGKRV